MSPIRSTRSLALVASLIAAATAAPAAVAQVEVTTRPLAAPDLWATPGRDTGLPADLWAGASSDLARAVLPELGARPIAPALRRLAIRLLATGAGAPEGGGEDATLAAERAAALTRLGAPDAAWAALARTPRVEASEPLSRARAEAALYLGRTEQACETERALQDGRGGGYWLKLRAFCLMQAGETAAAQVTFDLWRQTGERAPAYAAAMSAALGGTAWKPVLGDGLTYALARRGDADMASAVPQAAPAAVAVLALDERTSAAARAAAATRASALGLLSAAAARAATGDAVAPSAESVPDAPAPPPSLEEALGRTAVGSPAERTAARADALLVAALAPSDRSAVRAAAAGLDAPAPKIAASRLVALQAAADAGRTGETALLVLWAAASAGAEPTVADRALLVRALARAGLTADAEALVREGLSAR